MARYDRLRADGMSAAEAMREAAPLFARPSRAYDAPSTPRPVLAAGDGAGPARAADGASAFLAASSTTGSPWWSPISRPAGPVRGRADLPGTAPG